MQEPKPINLKNASLPKMIGDLMHSNQFLKIFSLSSLLLVFMVLGALMVFATKDPLVITLGPDGKTLERVSLPKPEDQVQEAVKRYIEKRYRWEPESVTTKLKESEAFIQPGSVKAFQAAMVNIVKFSKEKIVSQMVYPTKIDVDMNKKTALIVGDRITTIQGLKAAGGLKLELTFENGPRTDENPWGLYIAKEREE